MVSMLKIATCFFVLFFSSSSLSLSFFFLLLLSMKLAETRTGREPIVTINDNVAGETGDTPEHHTVVLCGSL